MNGLQIGGNLLMLGGEKMTNFEKIKNMNKEEIIEFLNSLVGTEFDDTIIFKWFKEKYCEVCPDIEIIYHGKNDLWKECYFEGVCPHQDWDERLIKLWLNAEI